MKFMIIPILFSFVQQQSLKIDFGKHKSGTDWYVVNDGVMGGLSESNLTLTESAAILKGDVSLENNGGFASFRSPFQKFDLSQYTSVEIRYRSVAQDVGLVFALHRRWYQPNYKIIFAHTNGDWKTLTIDLSTAKEYRIARHTGEFLRQDQLDKIIRLGFITQSKQAGSFEFEVDYITFI